MYQSAPPTLERIRGTEILAFDHVELTRTKVGASSFVGIGALTVVYFHEIQRFVLYLGEWEYALLKRLPVTGSSRTEMKTRFYTFPTYCGYYTVKITKIPQPEAIQNFETILSHFAKFSYLGEELPVRQVELSPDISLEEPLEGRESMSSSVMSLEESTEPHLRGKDKLKRGWAKFTDKLHGSYAKHHKDNLFLTRVMEIQDLTAPGHDFAEFDEFARQDVDRLILKSKDIATKMHFGASPNELQIIDTTLLREKIAEEALKEGAPMTESIKMTSYREGGVEYFVTEQELEIIKQIDQERAFQDEERRLQERHRQNELALIDEERRLRNLLRQQQEEKRVFAVSATSSRMQGELSRREEMILEAAREREAELLAYEKREQDLIVELERRLSELRARDKLTEEEHAEFARRERELMDANTRIEARRREAELREAEVRKTVETKMLEIQRRMRMTETERENLRKHEEELEREINARLADLRNRANLTEAERKELLEKEESLRKLAAMKEAERLQIIKERDQLVINSTAILEEMAERKRLTENERAALKLREKAIEEQAAAIIRDLLAKEALTEAERAELADRQKTVSHIAALREAERVEIVRRQDELAQEAARREAVLMERQRLTEAEIDELEQIRIRLQRENAMNEREQQNLILQRNLLLDEAEKREAEINRRISLTESERQALEAQEAKLEAEIQRKLAELRLKEDLTEGERIELQMREKELVRLHEMKKMETVVRTGQIDKLRNEEEKLIKQNMELIEGHKQMHNEIIDLTNELEKPLVEVRETKTVTVQRTGANLEDVTAL